MRMIESDVNLKFTAIDRHHWLVVNFNFQFWHFVLAARFEMTDQLLLYFELRARCNLGARAHSYSINSKIIKSDKVDDFVLWDEIILFLVGKSENAQLNILRWWATTKRDMSTGNYNVYFYAIFLISVADSVSLIFFRLSFAQTRLQVFDRLLQRLCVTKFDIVHFHFSADSATMLSSLNYRQMHSNLMRVAREEIFLVQNSMNNVMSNS